MISKCLNALAWGARDFFARGVLKIWSVLPPIQPLQRHKWLFRLFHCRDLARNEYCTFGQTFRRFLPPSFAGRAPWHSQSAGTDSGQKGLSLNLWRL